MSYLLPPFPWGEIEVDLTRIQAKLNQVERCIYPPAEKVFRALSLTPLEKVKVVILGQDPYMRGQADGLSFSTRDRKTPASLLNIFKELKNDLKIPIPYHSDLTTWAKQGVLLLNCAFTVEEGESGSHRNFGWIPITNSIIKAVSDKGGVVFLLWGKYAQDKKSLIDKKRNLILTAAHPSPHSVWNGFYGCRHFSRANQYLIEQGQEPVDWRIPNR